MTTLPKLQSHPLVCNPRDHSIRGTSKLASCGIARKVRTRAAPSKQVHCRDDYDDVEQEVADAADDCLEKASQRSVWCYGGTMAFLRARLQVNLIRTSQKCWCFRRAMS
jgi:hypothetical protein